MGAGANTRVAQTAYPLAAARPREWLERLPNGRDVQELARSAPPDDGFPSLTSRVVDATKPESVMQLLRELSQRIDRSTELVIGGSIALLTGMCCSAGAFRIKRG